MNYWLDILNNYTNYNTIPYNINVNKNISTIINIFYEKNYFLDFETEYIKKNFSNLVDAIHNITDISYNKDIRFNFYNNIFDNLNTIYNNNIQYKKNITFCFYKLFIKLLHTKKCYIIFNNSKYENSINLIKKYNYNFLDVFNINEIVIKYGSFGTLKLLQKNFIFFDFSNFSTDQLIKCFNNSLHNNDDRIYKNLLYEIQKFDIEKKYFVDNIGWNWLNNITLKNENYKLKRLCFINKIYDISSKLDEILLNFKYKNKNTLEILLKYYYYNFINTGNKNNMSKKDKIYLIIDIISNNFSFDKKTKHQLINKLQLYFESEYINYFIIKLFDSILDNFWITTEDISIFKYLDLSKKFFITTSSISIINHFFNNSCNEYTFRYNLKYFTYFLKLHNKNILTNILYSIKITNKSKFLLNKLLILSPFVNYIDNKFNKDFFYVNKILKHLKKFIQKKKKLKKFIHTINFKSNLNKININNLTNFNINAYHLLPYQYIKIPFIIREKADGVLVKKIPNSIFPPVYFKYNIKAEYIEEYDIYLVFDIDIPNKTIQEKYDILRSYHLTCNKTSLQNIKSFYDLKKEINDERHILKKFITNNINKTKWYPKGAWKVRNFSYISDDILSFVNLQNKNDISWLCESFLFKFDGFIISPIDNTREIKVKPKTLMTIDLLYKNNKFYDNDNNTYNIKTDDNLILSNNTVWRCYPTNCFNNFYAKDLRYDKKYPNSREVVQNILKITKIRYKKIDLPNLYYKNFKFVNDKVWNNIYCKTIKILFNLYLNLNISEKHNILDLACGKSKIVNLFKFNKYYGVDYDINILINNLKYSKNNEFYNYLDLSKKWNNQNSWNIIDENIKYDFIFCINSLMLFCNHLFWHQITKILQKNTKLIINLVNYKSYKGYKFNNSYIYKKNDNVHFYFENVHNSEMIEKYVSFYDLHYYIKKYKLKIIDGFTPYKGLHSLYSWYIITI